MSVKSSKRKRDAKHDIVSEDESSGFEEAAFSDDSVDIASALTGGKGKGESMDVGEDDFDDLEDLIKQSVTKRDKKEGTKLMKKTKGKTSMAKGEVGGGSFQSMGLHPSLLRSLTLQGYKIPTPIQRLSIPILLGSPPRDLVGMARTGSGKTLAYMVPLVQRLGGRHASTFGTRALILVPARELAVQVLKVGKELVRSWNTGSGDHAGDNDDVNEGKSQRLRWGLVVGGESLDEQFEMIASNPDVIIATPGRLLHLIVEMNLDLRAIQYVVFDEADRLFEMGFDTALTEILHKLPTSRQTLLFSATLPKSLVDFAKAGLQDPKLVRLDVESKISQDLRMAFFSVKQVEKEACLLILLRDLIRVPLGYPEKQEDEAEETKPKGKGKAKEHQTHAAPHQTLIFAATKHHVEYLMNLLISAGYSVSHIYGSLDQAARTQQMDRFRRGLTNILVVTDVAARGIDIPVLAHVINYDFPHGARVFVHRVGRTARAGRKGWAWSFVSATELPHMLDLQLFLGRPVKNTVDTSGERSFVENLVVGPFPRDRIDDEMEYVRALDGENRSLESLREVMRKGQAMYERSQGKASSASYNRGKEMMKSGVWSSATSVSLSGVGAHPVFKHMQAHHSAAADGEGSTIKEDGIARSREEEKSRQALLKAVNSFTPSEIVFEIGSRGKDGTAALMKDRRKALSRARERAIPTANVATNYSEDVGKDVGGGEDVEMAGEDDIEATFASGAGSSKRHYRDSEFYMSHYQKDANTEKGYSLTDGASFIEQARHATFDLAGDEGVASRQRHNSQLRWDRKKKRFIKGDGAGADNVKMVKTESGAKLPASYRSGRFDEWKAKTHSKLPRVGDSEGDTARRAGGGGNRFKHKLEKVAKPLDKLNTDYERKMRQMKKKQSERQGEGETESERRPSQSSTRPPMKKGAKGKPSRYGGKAIGRVKSELKSAEQIRKTREIAERKRARNARPSKKGRR